MVIGFIYFTFEMIKACLITPRMIEKSLENSDLKVSDLSQWQLDALLAVEDPNFYNHNGVDLKTPGAGITTITQGLVKIFYFEEFKPGFDKIKQTLIARFVMDRLVTKDEQLTLFLNYVYLGNIKGKLVRGFEQAAKAYYNKTVKKLSKDEYLSIVAMIIAPNNFHINDHPEANAERTKRIKKVVSGEYKPKKLMDLYYGELDEETQKGLPPASYFPSLVKNKCLESLQLLKAKIKNLSWRGVQSLSRLFATEKNRLLQRLKEL
jgi:membrane carboxypeptidase/penicillin-binding protein